MGVAAAFIRQSIRDRISNLDEWVVGDVHRATHLVWCLRGAGRFPMLLDRPGSGKRALLAFQKLQTQSLSFQLNIGQACSTRRTVLPANGEGFTRCRKPWANFQSNLDLKMTI
jgi:hypothetical protein